MKKTVKMLSIVLLITIIAMFSFGVTSNAGSTTGSGTSDSADVVNGLFSGGNADTSGIQGVGTNIVSIITTIGIIVAVIVLLILGIKYMMGSASEKAEYKKTMIPYLIGAVLIFGASAIAKAVIAMSETITST